MDLEFADTPYLPCPSTPVRGTVRAFSRHTTPSADFCARPPGDGLTPTARISWVSSAAYLAAPPISSLDGFRLAARTIPASEPVPVRRGSRSASFRPFLAGPPLRFARTSPPSGCTGGLSHPEAAGHAQHTAWPFGPPPLAASGLTPACPPNAAPPSDVCQIVAGRGVLIVA